MLGAGKVVFPYGVFLVWIPRLKNIFFFLSSFLYVNAHPSHSDSPGPIHRACPCWLDHPCSLSFIDVCVLLISGSRFQSAQTGMCTFLLHQMLTSVEDARQKKKKKFEWHGSGKVSHRVSFDVQH